MGNKKENKVCKDCLEKNKGYCNYAWSGCC
jgi:hypothetical protein